MDSTEAQVDVAEDYEDWQKVLDKAVGRTPPDNVRVLTVDDFLRG